MAKLNQLVMGRQAIKEAERRPFFVYIDEFQHFVTPSMATLLTGARKYRLGLILAHQELRQLINQDRDVASAVLANAATRICFRVGDEDAKKLEDGFATFGARDLQNLGRGQAVCRVDRADWDFSLTTTPLAPLSSAERERGAALVEARPKRPAAEAQQPTELRNAPAANPSAERVTEPKAPQRIAPEPTMSEPLAGRGGSQHKYLQELVRRWAAANEWRATIEKPVLNGLGNIDIALERGEIIIACEIAISSTTEREIANLRKCLTAGCGEALSVVPDARFRKALSAALKKQLEKSEAERVQVLSPEELFGYLGRVAAQEPAEQLVRGYKVRVNRSSSGSGSAKSLVAKTLATALKRLRKP